MGNPVSRTYSAASVVPGPQTPVNMDFIPFGTTLLGVAIVEGEASFSVEFTLDDVNDPNVTAFWFTLDDIPAGTNETTYASVYFPLRFVRLNLEALTGTVQFKVAQSTTPRA